MKKIDIEALAEVDEIISIMPVEDSNKIPNKFKKFIKDKKAKYYKPNIDKNVPIYQQKLKKDTFVICALIYRKWL